MPVARRTRRRLLLVVAASLTALLSAEIALRIAAPLLHPQWMRIDDRLGWCHKENGARSFVNEDGLVIEVSADAYGHRASSVKPAKVSGKFRVLALGDSFTEGTQVADEELYTSVLRRSQTDLEVLNSGVGGWGTVQQLVYLRERGLKFSPDLVLLAIYRNDLEDNCLSFYPSIGARPYAVIDDDELRVITELQYEDHAAFLMPAPFRSTLEQWSQLYRTVNKNFYLPMYAEQLDRLEGEYKRRTDGAQKRQILAGVLELIRAELAAVNIPLAVVLIPSTADVQAGRIEQIEWIAAHGKAHGYPVLSLLEALRLATGAGKRCYFQRDIHWTSEGHAVAGSAIATFVASLR